MPGIAADTRFDSTLAFLSGGYPFISDRCRRLHADAFETRLMLRRVVCALGEDAARMFFQPGRFTRRGAVPKMALVLLQDLGSIQTLDGDDHHERKQRMLTSGMDYTVPEQDLTIDLRRIPARPRSRFIISRMSAAPRAERGSGERAVSREKAVP